MYKKGADNKVADALSRRSSGDSDQALCMAISSPQPKWLDEIAHSYAQDEFATQLIAKLVVDGTAVPHYTWSQGLLRYKGRIWVGKNQDLHTKLLASFHSLVARGHSRIYVTYRQLKQFFAWKGMKTVGHEFVKVCIVYQQAKPDIAKSLGLLQPLFIPEGAWTTITMDFVEGLPQSGNANYILVVVDKFIKYAHFLSLKYPFTAVTVAKLFLDNIYMLHGMPLAIVSDRDRVFTSKF
jgi:hypothetical protein